MELADSSGVVVARVALAAGEVTKAEVCQMEHLISMDN